MGEGAKTWPTAGMVVIGNEVLSGKVADTNSPFLCRELNFLGIELREIVTIPDDFERIGAIVREFSERFTWVFTSGGIGPTHDDITVPAIAAGFGCQALRNSEIEAALRRHFRERLTEEHLNMALVPEGADLIPMPGPGFAQIQFHNIFILPGVPQLFEFRFNALKKQLEGQPVVLREFFLRADEGVIAGSLREVAERFPEVLIGSYPDFFKSDYSVKITLEARAQETVAAAVAELQAKLEALPITIVRVN